MRLESRDYVAPAKATVAAGLLSGALQITNGHYSAKVIYMVTAAWVLVLAAVVGHVPAKFSKRVMSAGLAPILALVLFVQLGLLATEPPTVEMVVKNPTHLHLFHFFLVWVALLTGVGLVATQLKLAKVWFPLVVVFHLVMGCLVLRFVEKPDIDVWSIEMESVKALLGGTNPYAITFEDPYNGTSPYFPPGASVDGRLQFGFVYPPLTLLMCVPGYLLGGDTRWSTLIAMEGAALFIGYCRPGNIPKLAAVAFLFMPRTFFVMDRAWTDAFVVLLTAAICFTALRKPRWLFVPLGLYVCLKQQMFIGIPALFLLMPRPIPWRQVARLTAKAAAVAGAVTLPLVLWSPRAFYGSALNIREMFRVDSLGLVAHLHNTGTATLSKWVGLAVVVPVSVLVLWRAPRTPGGFALGAAATHFSLYIWSTHAFCNEYYNVVGALFFAVAAWGSYDAKNVVAEASGHA